ncbi:hypothetical protein DdX_16074 [Ditylenchus destructor]|uniref:Uncharacterized protein n=1 Tax=Ditylenchus destructor TaxID=166010 RepID=A0AAD4MPB3_9BILA|nr:hypothetical protein DdX_16074 [Ditylenchus destructor]
MQLNCEEFRRKQATEKVIMSAMRIYRASNGVEISSSPRDIVIYVDEGLCSVVSALKHSFIDKFEVVHFQDSLSNACDVLDKLKSLAVIRKLMIDGEVDTRKCAANGIVSLDFDRKWPEKGDYELTEDGILDFCFGTEAAQISKPRKLVVGHCRVSRNLFLRLVKASEQSKIITPLQLKIYGVKLESQQLGNHKGIEESWTTIFRFPTHSIYTEIQFEVQCPDCTYVLHLNRGATEEK